MSNRKHLLFVRFYPHDIENMTPEQIHEKIKLINIEKRSTLNNDEFFQLHEYEIIYKNKLNNYL